MSTLTPPIFVRKVSAAVKSPTRNVTVCPGIGMANGKYFPSSTRTESTSTPLTKALTRVPSGAGDPSMVTVPTSIWGGRSWPSWSKFGTGVGGGVGVTIPIERLGVAVAVGATVGVDSGVAVGAAVGVGTAVAVGTTVVGVG